MGSAHAVLYNDSDAPLIHNLDWMKDIPDQTHLSQMTIPGTHDSCSLFGICCARTQTWTLNEQLNAGIRYLDVRLRRINNILRAYHAFVDQKENFDSILNIVIGFLNRNPTETVIMEINSEHTPLNSTRSFVDLYEEYTRNYKDKIVEYDYKDLTIGELRGKLYILKIFEGSISRTRGIFLQNKWSINFRWYINTKKRKIKEFFNRVTTLEYNNENNNFINDNSNDKKNLYITYISCSSDYAMMTPYTAATKCNPLIMRYSGRLGVVNMDYPGEDLIKHLIRQNFMKKNIQREPIMNGDSVYIVHNDTRKYLFLDRFNEQGNYLYCIKRPEPLKIILKNNNERQDFRKGDEIYIQNLSGYKLDFRIDDIFHGNDDHICEMNLFILQVKRNEEYEYMECSFDNKDKDRRYLFNFTKNKGEFSFYYYMLRTPNQLYGINDIIG